MTNLSGQRSAEAIATCEPADFHRQPQAHSPYKKKSNSSSGRLRSTGWHSWIHSMPFQRQGHMQHNQDPHYIVMERSPDRDTRSQDGYVGYETIHWISSGDPQDYASPGKMYCQAIRHNRMRRMTAHSTKARKKSTHIEVSIVIRPISVGIVPVSPLLDNSLWISHQAPRRYSIRNIPLAQISTHVKPRMLKVKQCTMLAKSYYAANIGPVKNRGMITPL